MAEEPDPKQQGLKPCSFDRVGKDDVAEKQAIPPIQNAINSAVASLHNAANSADWSVGTISNKGMFAARCRDTAQDHRGFIVYIDDDDLDTLVTARRESPVDRVSFELLRSRFNALVM